MDFSLKTRHCWSKRKTFSFSAASFCFQKQSFRNLHLQYSNHMYTQRQKTPQNPQEINFFSEVCCRLKWGWRWYVMTIPIMALDLLSSGNCNLFHLHGIFAEIVADHCWRRFCDRLDLWDAWIAQSEQHQTPLVQHLKSSQPHLLFWS